MSRTAGEHRFCTETSPSPSPRTALHVREGEPEDALPLARQGAVDLALAHHFDGPLPVGPAPGGRLTWTPLLEDPLHIVLPRGHRLAHHEAPDLADLAAEPWVLGCLKTEASCAASPRAPASARTSGGPPPTTSSPARSSPRARASR
ncbi:LysR substrate-binding domain-containing protein [Streptomyces sp. NE5-10]|uniref:LysR substrate-binding domain-containing protein n=1 Tax=Streptomyces sp. NE5-10 TaxID=2759674 RepID=UPI0027DB164A|nr:LysR substrate-binding domain-containing protein [Streptomyces sp. NE5-10]